MTSEDGDPFCEYYDLGELANLCGPGFRTDGPDEAPNAASDDPDAASDDPSPGPKDAPQEVHVKKEEVTDDADHEIKPPHGPRPTLSLVEIKREPTEGDGGLCLRAPTIRDAPAEGAPCVGRTAKPNPSDTAHKEIAQSVLLPTPKKKSKVVCDVCRFKAKSLHGLAIHCGRMHPKHGKMHTKNPRRDSAKEEAPNGQLLLYCCSFCGHKDKYKHGLMLHYERCHFGDGTGRSEDTVSKIDWGNVCWMDRSTYRRVKCSNRNLTGKQQRETCSKEKKHAPYQCLTCDYESHSEHDFDTHLQQRSHVGLSKALTKQAAGDETCSLPHDEAARGGDEPLASNDSVRNETPEEARLDSCPLQESDGRRSQASVLNTTDNRCHRELTHGRTREYFLRKAKQVAAHRMRLSAERCDSFNGTPHVEVGVFRCYLCSCRCESKRELLKHFEMKHYRTWAKDMQFVVSVKGTWKVPSRVQSTGAPTGLGRASESS